MAKQRERQKSGNNARKQMNEQQNKWASLTRRKKDGVGKSEAEFERKKTTPFGGMIKSEVNVDV